MRIFILILVAILNVAAISAQITYTDYEDTWAIDMNTPAEVDLNGDGIVDFMLNTFENELSFVPIFAIGCFASESPLSNNLNTLSLQTFVEGDLIKIDDSNMFDYIDDDRGSLYNESLGLADGWEANKRQYIGVAVFNEFAPQNVYEAWMSVSINPQTQQLIIHEAAYTAWNTFGEGGITVGDRGEAPTAIENIENLRNITIAPNPVQDLLNLSYDYTGSEPMTITITNTSGQLIYQQPANTFMSIATTDWSTGIYLIKFENDNGVEIRKVLKQ